MIRAELHWDRLVRCYADRPANLWAQLQGVFADKEHAEAVVEGSLRLPYGDLDRQSSAIAALLAAHGVGAGDRVAVMLPNGADAVRAVVAILRLGAILVAVSTRSRTAELEHVFGDAEPAAVIHAPAFAAEIAAAAATPAVRLDTAGPRWSAALRAKARPPPPPPMDGETAFAILYTSGTTGKPKGAVLTHLGVIHSCLHWGERFGLGSDERTLFCVPWAHVSGLCGVLMPILYFGGLQVMLPEFKRRAALELAAAERITHALMVPAMYGLCLLEPDLPSFDLSAWRIAAFGGAPMPEPTIARFAAVFPHLKMCNAYGATETTSPATIMGPGEGLAHLDSIGRVVACGDIKVMDEDGRELACGELGELWIAGPMVTPGYWRDTAATAASFAAGYWRSGDVGSIDAEGFVRIADRKKDMVIKGGFKVYPAEVESVIAGLDGVAETAVVGRPDPIMGERVVAFITTHSETVTELAVRAWCADRLSDYKVPDLVVVEADLLPRNVNGKVQKALLRTRAVALADMRAAS